MTISVTINGTQISPHDEAEINENINRRRNDGAIICVEVRISGDSVNLSFATRGCGRFGGGGGRYSDLEQRIINYWSESRLSEEQFSGGNLIAFLRRVERIT